MFTVKRNKKKVWAGVVLMLMAALLVACGDSPASTAAPVSTTTASATTTSAAGNPGTTSGTPVPGGQGRGNFSPPVSGTVQSVDATAKTLTVLEANGTSVTFDASTSRVVKTTTITKDDLAKLAIGNMAVQVVGTKGSDGNYNATRIVLVDPTTLGGTGGQGTPGAGRQGQLPANGTPGARGQGANGTPGAGGARGGLIVSKPVLTGTTLTGTDFSGAAVTVNLSDSTFLSERVAGTITDLKSGETVSVNARPAQSGAAAAAAVITIGE
jgi:hypothetical protein